MATAPKLGNPDFRWPSMPRAPRLRLPGVPLHIVQRSVNRCAVFLCNEERGFYLGLLERAFRAEAVALHA